MPRRGQRVAARIAGLCCPFFAAVLAAPGCDAGDPGRAGPTVRDSLGIRIVEHVDVHAAREAAWRLTGAPRVNVGALDAEPPYQFDRLVGAAVVSRGRIVVADAGSHEIRWFGADGAHLATAGGRGEGPGEFTALAALAVLPGDSVVVYDEGLRRFTLYDADGTFVRTAPLDREQRPGMDHPVLVGALADGSMLMAGRVLQFEGMTEGPLQSLMPLYRYRPDGSVIDSLCTFPGWEASVVIRQHDDVVGMSIRNRPFGRTTSITPVGSGFAAGTPHTFSFDVFDADGTLRSIVRVLRPNDPITPADIATYEAGRFEDVEDANARRELERELGTLDYPDTKPAYGALLGDRDGNVWVGAYQVDRDQPGQWDVFGLDGIWVASMTTPSAFRVTDVGSDFVLGIWQDEFDVEYLQLYDLIKP